LSTKRGQRHPHKFCSALFLVNHNDHKVYSRSDDLPRTKSKQSPLRKYGEEHHIEQLTKSKWKGTEDDAWAMAALAVKLCEKQGAYRGPSGNTYVFIAFGEVKLSKK
jgi:hypothetical protein